MKYTQSVAAERQKRRMIDWSFFDRCRKILHVRGVRTLLRLLLRFLFGKRGSRRLRGLRLWFRMRTEVILHAPLPVQQRLARHVRIRIWVDGTEAFPRMVKLLRHAHHTVLVQMFIWKDDDAGRRIAAALLEAADRGVKVTVMKDASGDVFEYHKDFLTTAQSSDGIWHRFWRHRNISVGYGLHYDHAKVFIIDDQTMLVGGMNIADETAQEWHDFLIELRGGRFVQHYLTGHDPLTSDTSVRLVLNTEEAKSVRPALRRLLLGAKREIILEQSYLDDRETIDLLAERSHEGIRITLILPEAPDVYADTNARSVRRLMERSDLRYCQVLLYPAMSHAKLILVDRARALVGSANIMASSLDRMGEVNVLIEGRFSKAMRKLKRVTRSDVLQSRPLVTPPRLFWITRLLTWWPL
ncbi:MAG: phosphatidylserine/phosphatidylglycerophosphate/cardiolipin synthase family protein [Candidatus Peregrinibacteria bacterium]